MSDSLGLFGGRDRPDVASAWKLYEERESFKLFLKDIKQRWMI